MHLFLVVPGAHRCLETLLDCQYFAGLMERVLNGLKILKMNFVRPAQTALVSNLYFFSQLLNMHLSFFDWY